MFTIHTGPAACRNTQPPTKLVATALSVNVGDRLHLSDPVVAAYDARGEFMPRVPISIGCDTSNGVFVRDVDADQITFVATKPGVAEFSVASFCPGASASTTVFTT